MIVWLGLLLLPAACSGSVAVDPAIPDPRPSFSASTTMSRLAQDQRIRVAIWYDMPGFGVRNGDGAPAGFDVEIAKIIAARLGIGAEGITWVRTLASERESLIRQDVADLVVATLAMSPTPGDEPVHIAGPYLSDGLQLLVPTDSAMTGLSLATLRERPELMVCTVLDLKDAVPRGDTETEQSLPPPSQVHRLESMSDCMDALRNDQVDAVVGPVTTMRILAAQSAGTLAVTGGPLGRITFGVGVTDGDSTMCAFIAQTLAGAASTGTYLTGWAQSAGKLADLPDPTLPTPDPCR